MPSLDNETYQSQESATKKEGEEDHEVTKAKHAKSAQTQNWESEVKIYSDTSRTKPSVVLLSEDASVSKAARLAMPPRCSLWRSEPASPWTL